MSRMVDLTGQRFNNLVVLYYDEEKSKKMGRTYWVCQCDCGKIISVNSSKLTLGLIKSCGCKSIESNKRFTEIYMNDNKGYGVAFVRNKNEDGSYNDDYFTVFDAVDKDIVQNGAWRVNKDGYLCGYARGSHTDSKSVLLHRAIAGKYYDIDGKLVDHIDHNPFVVRHDNLRPATAAENALNRNKYCCPSDKPADMRNIFHDKKTGKYIVSFRFTTNKEEGSKKVSKHFDNVEDAKKYRDEYIANSPYRDFYYNPEDDIRNEHRQLEFRIGGDNITMHPFHIYDENDMPLPDPDKVIRPFTNMPSITQPIFNPFTIVNPLRFTKGKY